MIWVVGAFALFCLGALVARWRIAAYAFASAGSLAAAAAGLSGLAAPAQALQMPFVGRLWIGIGLDRLSGTFLLISSVVWLMLSLSSIRSGGRQRVVTAVAYNVAIAGMVIVLTALDAVTLLVGWEIMTIFVFLALFERSRSERPPILFLAFGELSTLLLVLAFALRFALYHTISLRASDGGVAFFALASLGMIVKMDIVPFHAWMRRAYEQLPGNLAGVASVGVTLAGVYGLERVASIGGASGWWPLLLLLLGAASAFWGALQAAGSDGLRLLPAYSTVESNGLILSAVALSLIAAQEGGSQLAYLASFAAAAALTLAIAHALAKTLLFLSIGEAGDALGTDTLRETKSVWTNVGPVPALGIAIGGLSLAAFPPLIGYVGEWMLLETTFQAYRFTAFAARFITSFAGVLIALAIGLTAFAMVKLIGYTVLGRERRLLPKPATSSWLSAPQISLAGLILLCGVGIPALLPLFGFGRLFSGLLGVPKPLLLVSGIPLFGVLSPTLFAAIMIVLSAIPILSWLARRRRIRAVDAWNGGIEINQAESFTSPAYTQILASILKNVYRTREHREGSARSVETTDFVADLTRPIRRAVDSLAGATSRLFMNGRIAAYVLYIVIILVIAFVVAAV